MSSQIATPAIPVLHVINGEHYSGAERVQDLLALQLSAEGFDVGFACLKPGRFPEARRSQKAALHALPMRGRFDLRVAWRLADVIRREGYRLVHAHTPRAALVGRLASWLAGMPLVYHVHSPTARDSTRWFVNRVNAAVEALSLAGVSRLIAVSAALGRQMEQEGYAASKVAVVWNGVPARPCLPPRNPPQQTWTVGTAALFRPRKGMEVLLDAAALLRTDGLPVRLLAVGPCETPAYEAELRARVRQRGLDPWIEWRGFVQDVDAELARMDLFVLPSLFGEGLPMVVLEAMAAGVPVIASRVEAIPAAIRDGVDGLLAEPGDAADLARAIGQVIRGASDWSALRENAWQRQTQQFSDRAMAAGVARVYRELLQAELPAHTA